jgi:hypothetical protein
METKFMQQESQNKRSIIYGYFTVQPARIQSGRFDDYRRPKAGYICVALERPAKGASGLQNYKAAFSFCSPLDKFNKAKARKIATGKLLTERKKLHVGFDFDRVDNSQWQKVFETALHLGLKSTHEGKGHSTNSEVSFAPSWLQNFLEKNAEVSYGLRRQNSTEITA